MTDIVAAAVSRFDTSVAHSARLWNYLLGGKENFAVDRSAAKRLLAALPELTASARATRDFLQRAVGLLTAEVGIRHFIDIGPGLPALNNTHEVAQKLASESRVLYVDNDPMVLAHARALLTSTNDGSVTFLDADLRDLDSILEVAIPDEPVAVILLGVLSYLTDDEQAYGLVHRLVEALPSGSHLVIGHPTWEVNPTGVDRVIDTWNAYGGTPMCARTPAAIERFFTGLDLLDPGLVSCSQWRPDDGAEAKPVVDFAGVARKS